MQIFVNAWSEQYDFDRYPIEFYYQCIEQIRISDKPIEFARYVIAMLHWKDGKVAKSPKGNFTIGGVRYTFRKPKPYIYNPKIQNIIESKVFFEWGKRFGNQSKFEASEVRSLTEPPFNLWSNNAVVMPTFILHILSPLIYSLYDQHVERAKRALNAERHLNNDAASLSLASYKKYGEFFEKVVAEYYGFRKNILLEEIKVVDNALWCFGKWLKAIKGGRNTFSNNPEDLVDQELSAKAYGARPAISSKRETAFKPDEALKKRVMELIGQGYTQLKAMEAVSEERNVKLSKSYYQHPGSHIDRWRKQGF